MSERIYLKHRKPIEGSTQFYQVEQGVGADCLTLWFSYNTIIGFQLNGRRVVRENLWGPTTGRHLNWIDDGDKEKRVSGDEFDRRLAEAYVVLGGAFEKLKPEATIRIAGAGA